MRERERERGWADERVAGAVVLQVQASTVSLAVLLDGSEVTNMAPPSRTSVPLRVCALSWRTRLGASILAGLPGGFNALCVAADSGARAVHTSQLGTDTPMRAATALAPELFNVRAAPPPPPLGPFCPSLLVLVPDRLSGWACSIIKSGRDQLEDWPSSPPAAEPDLCDGILDGGESGGQTSSPVSMHK